MLTFRKQKVEKKQVFYLLSLMILIPVFLLFSSGVAGAEETETSGPIGGTSDWTFASNGSNQPAPLMLVPRPPEDTDFNVQVWTDRKTYSIGDSARINFQINKNAYVYILHHEPGEGVKLVYPNRWESNDPRRAGVHQLPTARYSFGVTGPSGTKYLQALATTKKIDIYDFVRYPSNPFRKSGFPEVPNPQKFRDEIKSGLKARFGFRIGGEDSGFSLQLTPVEWSTDFYNYRVGPQRKPPVAEFNYQPKNPSVGETVRFDGTPSYAPDGSIVAWEWDLTGDGRTNRTGRRVWESFGSAGRRQVTLTVRDDNGTTSSTTKTIDLGPSRPQFNLLRAENFSSNASREQNWYWHRRSGTSSRWDWYSLPHKPNKAYLNFDFLVSNQRGGSGYDSTIRVRITDQRGNYVESGTVDLTNTFRPRFSEDTGGVGYEASGAYRIRNPGEIRDGFRVRVEWPPRNNRNYFATRKSAVSLAYEY